LFLHFAIPTFIKNFWIANCFISAFNFLSDNQNRTYSIRENPTIQNFLYLCLIARNILYWDLSEIQNIKKKCRLGHFFSSITQAILERLANSSANLSYEKYYFLKLLYLFFIKSNILYLFCIDIFMFSLFTSF